MKILTKRIASLIILAFVVIHASAQTDKEFQLSFVTPMGTNGTASQITANDFSFNILGGVSRANNVFEFGGLYNINLEQTKGFQFAGLTNISKRAERSVQFAGIANINSNQDKGVQMAGVSNVASKGKVDLQAAGILNIARVVGTQVGLINIADSVTGTSIGLINIVKRGGKRELEIGFSEVLNTYLSFKLGTDKFYTIFSGGLNYYDWNNTKVKKPIQYALGVGFGTDIALKKGYATQLEIMGYELSEKKKFQSDLNLLTQFKFSFSKSVRSGLKLYAGPVANLTVSQYKTTDGELVGSQLAPYTLFKDEGSKTQLKGWLGFTIGLRY
jgi:hypothetical protein